MYNLPGLQRNKKSRAYERARWLFWRLYWAARYKRWWARLRGRSRDLLWLGDMERCYNVLDYRALEIGDVRVSLIQGSHNQSRTYYDVDWLPLTSRLETRWVSVASLMLRDVTRVQPVDLVQVEDVYYVVDGHHRVSAARALGYLYLSADVVVWEVEPKPGDDCLNNTST